MDVRLRPFTVDDEAEALAAHDELAAEGFEFLLEDRSLAWPDYVARLQEVARGERLAPDRVPAALLVVEVDGQLAGRVSIRYALNDFLRLYGGHIGYGVRPAWRRRGVATATLRLALADAQAHGIECALVTCDDGNIASAATIERCGGLLQGLVTDDGVTKRRYWVPTG